MAQAQQNGVAMGNPTLAAGRLNSSIELDGRLDESLWHDAAMVGELVQQAPNPGNNLFIVWNHGWKRLIVDWDDLNLIPESELLAVKLRLTFRR